MSARMVDTRHRLLAGGDMCMKKQLEADVRDIAQMTTSSP